MPGLPPRQPNDGSLNGRFDRWVKGWLLGKQGISGAGHDLASSVDPRTRQGALGLAGMFVPGRFSQAKMADTALAMHTGHLNTRPYRASSGLFPNKPDHQEFGGMRATDLGYPASAYKNNLVKSKFLNSLADIHAQNDPRMQSPGLQPLYDAIHEVNPTRLPDLIIKLLQKPYVSYKNLNN